MATFYFYLFFWCLLGGFFLPLIILAIQIIAWLKTGEWYPLAVADVLNVVGIGDIRFKWLGAQKIYDIFLQQSFGLVFFLAAMLASWGLSSAMEAAEKLEREQKRSK